MSTPLNSGLHDVQKTTVPRHLRPCSATNKRPHPPNVETRMNASWQAFCFCQWAPESEATQSYIRPESWSAGVPFNLKPRSFVPAASQRTLEHSAYVHSDKPEQPCLRKKFTKPPMNLLCFGLSQSVLSASSDNHPAGPAGLIAGTLDIFAPEITREKGEPSKQSMLKPLCNSPALAFASSQNRAQVQFFMQNRCRPFPSDHLQGSSDISGVGGPFHTSSHASATCNTTPP
ncbi:hypothetical protein NA56DRAFT_698348 [Hyaloscypha hepaticicola]|uniref:Uncharacterized protein n=1 Tax=Hyaloscypha hepaticicola TaxID=2082293 RepID=A0A2J6QIV0_9HELO|nr:hypothetical protein NA56DRAFT_698348 [Hyaloscypha hepaticicola]